MREFPQQFLDEEYRHFISRIGMVALGTLLFSAFGIYSIWCGLMCHDRVQMIFGAGIFAINAHQGAMTLIMLAQAYLHHRREKTPPEGGA